MTENVDFITVVGLSEEENYLVILDQTKLPGKIEYLYLDDKEAIWDAIFKLKVRGAPAIGVAAAYGLYVLSRKIEAESVKEYISEVKKIKDYLETSRPTAVNLFWALNRMEESVTKAAKESERINDVKEQLEYILLEMKKEAKRINKEDINTCKKIGENGLSLLKDGMGILTHCNAGALATSGCGTALAPLYVGQKRGYRFKVFADETRPLLQGARLTAWELYYSGVDVTLICDNMASAVMKSGKIQAVITGADRIAANGDTANKIGTSGIAILAKEYGIPMYINAPISTIDLNCKNGDEIIIEERDGREIYEMWFKQPVSVDGIKTFNPSFDVTDNKYISAIITERGIAYPPFNESIKNLFYIQED